MQETKAHYFARKIAEYDEEMTRTRGKEWDTHKAEYYGSEQGFFYSGMDEFMDWLINNE